MRDTGAGIDPALLPSIFDPFVQADRTLARSSGGLGLGLAMVRGITELHGGSVCAESKGPGTGARFSITLPLLLAGAKYLACHMRFGWAEARQGAGGFLHLRFHLAQLTGDFPHLRRGDEPLAVHLERP